MLALKGGNDGQAHRDRAGLLPIPLPSVLTDSMHGEMRAFELNTVRLRDADGAEGVGYTFTVGRNGARHRRGRCAREMTGDLSRARRPTRSSGSGTRAGGRCTTAAAAARPCWPSRPSTWRCGTSRRSAPACRCGTARRLRPEGAVLRRRHRPRPAARRAAAADRRQSRQGLSRHQDEGRPQAAVARTSSACAAMREHLGDGFPLMADANMKWSVDEAIRAARALRALRPHLARGADHPRRSGRPCPHRARGRPADRGGREPAHAVGVQAVHRRRRR